MNAPPPSPLPHFSLALEVLSHLPIAEFDLLARELNVYSEAIRSRGGRTTFTGVELQTLFMRMWDVAKIVPQVTSAEPADLDALAAAIREPRPPALTGLKVRRLE